MLCPICSKEMNNYLLEYLMGFDKPYMNIYMHKECAKTINKEYIVQNAELLYNNYIEQLNIKNKKGK